MPPDDLALTETLDTLPIRQSAEHRYDADQGYPAPTLPHREANTDGYERRPIWCQHEAGYGTDAPLPLPLRNRPHGKRSRYLSHHVAVEIETACYGVGGLWTGPVPRQLHNAD